MGSDRIVHLRQLADRLQAAGFEVNFSHVAVDIVTERVPALLRDIHAYDPSITATTSTVHGPLTHLRLSLGPSRRHTGKPS